jgi:polyisoprenoid-binding protein YceI
MQTGTQRGLAPVKYLIDATMGRFTVQAFATGLLSAFGHNPKIGIVDFDGEILSVPGSFEKAFVRLAVRTSGMEVLDEMNRDDRKKLEQLMYGEVLDVNQFPTAAYESREITVEKLGDDLLQTHVDGELTFRGVTQSHSFDARVTDLGPVLGITAEFSLRLSNYGIKPVSFAGGALRLKDEVKFNFGLNARRQE